MLKFVLVVHQPSQQLVRRRHGIGNMDLLRTMSAMNLIAYFLTGNRQTFLALGAIETVVGVSGRQTNLLTVLNWADSV